MIFKATANATPGKHQVPVSMSSSPAPLHMNAASTQSGPCKSNSSQLWLQHKQEWQSVQSRQQIRWTARSALLHASPGKQDPEPLTHALPPPWDPAWELTAVKTGWLLSRHSPPLCSSCGEASSLPALVLAEWGERVEFCSWICCTHLTPAEKESSQRPTRSLSRTRELMPWYQHQRKQVSARFSNAPLSCLPPVPCQSARRSRSSGLPSEPAASPHLPQSLASSAPRLAASPEAPSQWRNPPPWKPRPWRTSSLGVCQRCCLPSLSCAQTYLFNQPAVSQGKLCKFPPASALPLF